MQQLITNDADRATARNCDQPVHQLFQLQHLVYLGKIFVWRIRSITSGDFCQN